LGFRCQTLVKTKKTQWSKLIIGYRIAIVDTFVFTNQFN